MGLKFQRDDSLDRKFEEFAQLPKEKVKENKVDIQRFLEPEQKETKAKDKQK